jgi:hypothetical protein
MADMTSQEVDDIVLRVLAGQSEGYLIQPDATAFVVEGLDPETVSESLSRLEETEHAKVTQEVALRYVTEEVTHRVGSRLRSKKITHTEVKRDQDGEPVLEVAKDDNGNDMVVNEGWEVTDKGAKVGERLKRAHSNQ